MISPLIDFMFSDLWINPKNYTRQTIVGLPIDDTNLTTVFSSQNYIDVETKDNIYVTQSN